MEQSVNLFDCMPKRKREWFTALMTISVCFGFLILLLIFYGYVQWQTMKLGEQSDKLVIEKEKAADSLIKINKKYPKAITNKKLKEEVESLRKEYTKLVNKTGNFRGKVSLNTKGFSSYLIGLGNQIVPGVWLNQIMLRDGAQSINLKGEALNPQVVLQFVKLLPKAKAFKKMVFKVSDVKKFSEDKNAVTFILKGSGDLNGRRS